MKIKSAKAKGRALQNLVRDKLRDIFVYTNKIPRLHEDDIKSQTMGMTGEDIILSPKAREMIHEEANLGSCITGVWKGNYETKKR